MAMVIQNNMAAQMTLGELNKNVGALGKQLRKVASGERITCAGDDSSGYAISEKMRVRIRALGQADRNTQTGISLIRTAEGAIQSQIDILKTIKDKVLDAQNDTNTDVDRATIQKEIDLGYQQMEDIAWETNYNGILLLCGGDVVEYKHTNWSEEPEPEFGVHDNSTMGISPLITSTVTEVKSLSREWTGMNKQPLDPDTTVLDKTNSVYDVADKYDSSVKNTLSMTGGVDWQAEKNTITLNLSALTTADQVVNSLKNRRFTVTLTDPHNGNAKTTKQFTFADNLSYLADFNYDFTYQYTDEQGDTQTGTVTGATVSDVSVTPTASYTSGATPISLQNIKNDANGSAEKAANLALGALADKIADAFGKYNLNDPAHAGWQQSRIYGDSLATDSSKSVLTLASGDYMFTVTIDNDDTLNYSDSTLATRVQNLADAQRVDAAKNDLEAKGITYQGTPIPTTAANITTSTDISSTNGSNGKQAHSQDYKPEQSAYVDIDLDSLIAGATNIESLINNFTFKVKDDELGSDVDPTDTNVFDTGNNHVVDKSFSVASYNGNSITYEFIDSTRPDLDVDGNPVGTTAGTKYLYDEQKIPGSITRNLSRLREIYNSGGYTLKGALAQFLYESFAYSSFGRNQTYTRQLMDSGSNVVNVANNATKIRLYAYQPYAGSEHGSAPVTPSTSPYWNDALHSHYDQGRYSGKGMAGNDDVLTTSETFLTSYDLDLKKWWIENISADLTAPGDENTEAKVQERLNQRGFRFYCGDHNTASDLKEWVNIYFTDHSIEEDLALERPAAGKNLTTGDKIDTIVVDVRNIRTYKDLVRAIYEQANPAGAGGASTNVNQVGFDGNPLQQSYANTDYFGRFLFAMDEDKGILTIYDTKRSPQSSEMFVSDGVYDNVRLEVRELKEKRLIIHDTDHASQAVVVHVPRTTLDYVFGFNPAKASAADYTVLRKEMREQMLGMSKESVGILDRGLDYLTSANCLLGAQINRLEYSHANLTVSVENTTHSESTMRDADMAKEMMEYTKANVLMQAAQSMLAQANQNSSQIMSLLQ